jgi:hypothetical protein
LCDLHDTVTAGKVVIFVNTDAKAELLAEMMNSRDYIVSVLVIA